MAGRAPLPALDAAAGQLRGLGAEVRTVAFDALDPEGHEAALGKVFAEGDIDLVLLAFGILGDQAHDEREPLNAVRVAQTNYTGAVSAGLVAARSSRHRGTARWSCSPPSPVSGPAAPTSSTAPARQDWTPSRRAWATRCTARACTSWSYAPGSCGRG